MSVSQAEWMRAQKRAFLRGQKQEIKHRLSLVRVGDNHIAATCKCGAVFKLLESP